VARVGAGVTSGVGGYFNVNRRRRRLAAASMAAGWPVIAAAAIIWRNGAARVISARGGNIQ